MREVAIVSFAQAPSVRREDHRNEVEILMPVVSEAIEASGIERNKIGFTCSGSCDYLAGMPFSFVTSLDAIGAWPPIQESHVEMDGAWALYEAWVRLQHGDIDSALVYGYGKCSPGPLPDVLGLQFDPYLTQPLGLDSVSAAALQARVMIDAGKADERQMAEVAARSRRDAKSNPYAQLKGDFDVEAMLREPCIASPLRKHDCPPISDGAAAIVLATGDLAKQVCTRPAWIRGIDHRIDTMALGNRDLSTCHSASLAAQKAGVGKGRLDVAEIYAPFTHQEILLREAMGIADDVSVNPSGGALAAHPLMAAGLIRIGEAASAIHRGTASRTLGHATSGPALQQNLACVMEA